MHHIEVNRLLPGCGAAYGRRLAGVALIVLLFGLAACNRSAEVGAAPKPPSVTVAERVEVVDVERAQEDLKA